MRIIRGKYGRRRFAVPTSITARPTTDFARENIFNVIENLTDLEGIDALDLFAGTGAISFELLSRGARSVTAVEKAATQQRFIAKVASELKETNLRLVRGDVKRFLGPHPGSYDLVFADPPYDMPDFDDVVAQLLAGEAVRPGGLAVVEHSARRDYGAHPWFVERRVYGSVNFSIFRRPSEVEV